MKLQRKSPSAVKLVTREATILMFMRTSRKNLSAAKLGKIVGLSGSYIFHMEKVHSGHIVYTLYRRHRLHF